jgi:hypothetical protein
MAAGAEGLSSNAAKERGPPSPQHVIHGRDVQIHIKRL